MARSSVSGGRTGSEFRTLSLLIQLERLLADHDFYEMQWLLDHSDCDSHSSKLTPDQKQPEPLPTAMRLRSSTMLRFVQVLTQPAGNAAIDDTYSVLDLDALDELKSYTFDYRTMHFAVKYE